MTAYLFPPPPVTALPVIGETRGYPVARIFCVGRNYAAHAAEMGSKIDREAPFYFTKSPAAVLSGGLVLPYAPGTADLHYEIELVVAIGAPAFRIRPDQAESAIFGFGCGLDMTRRDLQARAKDRRQPWDTAKDFEGAAVLSALTPRAALGPVADRRITLAQNGAIRQDARLSDMVWPVPEIIADLSRMYHLRPGDLVMTGTPAGVGPVAPGDELLGRIEGLQDVTLTIGRAE